MSQLDYSCQNGNDTASDDADTSFITILKGYQVNILRVMTKCVKKCMIDRGGLRWNQHDETNNGGFNAMLTRWGFQFHQLTCLAGEP